MRTPLPRLHPPLPRAPTIVVAGLLACGTLSAAPPEGPAAPRRDAADAAERVEPVAKPAWNPGSDTSVVYRFDPTSETYMKVARGELKKGRVYYRHSDRLGRWVWSKADADGTLRYALGPGSSQPASLFDMPASSEERTKALEKQAPELAKRLAISGGKPSLRLGEDGRWTLMPDSTRGRILDLETGQRWEWHTSRVTPVTHGPGINAWTYADGRYLPVGSERHSVPPSYDW
ncbi:MAG: hypothetical protein ACKO5R_13470 [Planctomycetaceae bacterium]